MPASAWLKAFYTSLSADQFIRIPRNFQQQLDFSGKHFAMHQDHSTTYFNKCPEPDTHSYIRLNRGNMERRRFSQTSKRQQEELSCVWSKNRTINIQKLQSIHHHHSVRHIKDEQITDRSYSSHLLKKY